MLGIHYGDLKRYNFSLISFLFKFCQTLIHFVDPKRDNIFLMSFVFKFWEFIVINVLESKSSVVTINYNAILWNIQSLRSPFWFCMLLRPQMHSSAPLLQKLISHYCCLTTAALNSKPEISHVNAIIIERACMHVESLMSYPAAAWLQEFCGSFRRAQNCETYVSYLLQIVVDC